jgi:Tfp pilus assembly PilM family ATPase/Tfp pilus assembly protein PilN
MDSLSFFKKILVPEEPIAGLEITDSHLRLALLSLDKKTGLLNTRQYIEQPLEPGIIAGGKVTNPEGLCSALSYFKKNLKISVDYVIASIPSSGIYAKTITFPKNIEGEKLNEAIKLAVEFQFPYKINDVYCAWEIDSSVNPQKIFVAEAPKNVIDPYLECIRKVFNLVALEFHAASFSRVAALEKNKTFLLRISNLNSTNVFIIKNKAINFSRTLEYSNFPENNLPKELEKIINYYESSAKENVSAIISIPEESVPLDEKIKFHELNNGRWLVALGAALRGITPRREDNFISLSPISAQKAYNYHKAISFTSIMTGLAVGLAIFFIIAFLGTWILMISLQEASLNKTDAFNNLPSTIDLTAVETRIQNANSLTSITADILKNSPHWSILISELQNLIIPGITIESLSLPSAEGVFSFSGAAANRLTLNQFRDKLRSSVMLKNINLPLTNLDQEENIPFTISFELKNPASLYLK